MDPEKYERVFAEGRNHLKFCVMLHRIQMENKLYFLHEHPWSASSWREKYVEELLHTPGVEVVKSNMCHQLIIGCKHMARIELKMDFTALLL